MKQTRTAGRRAVLGASAAAVLTTVAPAIAPAVAQPAPRDYGPGASPARYPDPDVVSLDSKRFGARLGNGGIRRLHTGMGWAEGPAWHATGRFLIWSDIPNDECLRLTEEDRQVSRRFRAPSGFSNGNTFDREGRQIACRH
ncbi:MAG: SMP-30/gluconolactonase/LRE family protein, partial [Janthinobacterium lividum]